MLVRWSHPDDSPPPSAGVAEVRSASRSPSAQFIRTTGSGAAVFDLGRPLGAGAGEIVASLERLPGIASAELDLWMQADELPDDPHAAELWGLLGAADGSPFGIDVLATWPESTGSGVVVAVIDTGLVAHPDLAGQSVPGYDVISDVGVSNDGGGRDGNPADPGDWCGARPSSWHGTHVAGMIAAIANNGIGVFGGAPGVKIQPVRALGTCGGYSSDVADAIRWASGGSVPGAPLNATPARILNLSLSGASTTCPSEYASAIADARSRGALVVVSAGNKASDAAGYTPANCPDALTVAAIDREGLRAAFSNYGAAVDLAAPGVGVLSTVDSGSTAPTGPAYVSYDGTSMAAPHVALTAALIAEAEPSLDGEAIEAVLEASAIDPAADDEPQGCPVACGHGVVNAGRAIGRLFAPEPLVGGVAAGVPYPPPGGSVVVSAVAVDASRIGAAQVRVDAASWKSMAAKDGAFDEITERLSATVAAPSIEGDHEICVRAIDPDGHASDGAACVTITVDAGPPIVGTPAVAPGQPIVRSAVQLTATASDGVAIDRAEVRLDGGPWLPADAGDGAFGEAAETVTAEFGEAVTQVSSGAQTCVRLADATARCWGWNLFGQLGDGTTIDRHRPTRVRGLDQVAQIVAGQGHTCALLLDTTVQCWGWNAYGQLGDGTTTDRSLPVAVQGLSGVTSLALGHHRTCALLEDTTVRCWGANLSGQLGDGTRIERHTPTPVLGLNNVTALSGTNAHTCAVVAGGTVRCWGFNPYGGVGDGSTTDREEPVSVAGIDGVVGIATGYYHSCAVLVDRTVRCWGGNQWGQLGDGTKLNRVAPVRVTGLANVDHIDAGGQNGCALLGDDAVRCWGVNSGGEVGDGTYVDRAAPVQVSGLDDVDALSSGAGGSCTLVTDTTVRCWGNNLFGGVGDGTTQSRPTPIPVPGLGSLSVGAHSLCVRVTDVAGHRSSGSACNSISVTDPFPNVVAFGATDRAFTNDPAVSFDVTFDKAVTGLTTSDFTRTGTATGCTVNAPTGSGSTYRVMVSGCSAGTLRLELGASSVVTAGYAGPYQPIATPSVLIDRTAPTITAPSVSLRQATLTGTAAPAQVRWTAADAGGAGIARVVLARSLDGGATWATVSSAYKARTISTSLPTSGTVRYRMRSLDRAGNSSGWMAGPVMTPRLVQQTATSVQWGGLWTASSSTAYSGGSVRSSSSPGATATLTFTGRMIGLVATQSSAHGTARIYVDGALVGTVDCYDTAISHRRVVWQHTYATSATRTVKVVVVGTSGRPRIDIDAFIVVR